MRLVRLAPPMGEMVQAGARDSLVPAGFPAGGQGQKARPFGLFRDREGRGGGVGVYLPEGI
jgi:hypothetical protein